MTTNPDSAWLHKGAEVAIDGGSMWTSITFAHIERLTATQIVLDNGRRFRLSSDHRELGASDSIRAKLMDPRDPYVVNHIARAMLKDFVREGTRITDGSGATIGTMDARAVRETLNDLADKLDAARKEIDRRAGL